MVALLKDGVSLATIRKRYEELNKKCNEVHEAHNAYLFQLQALREEKPEEEEWIYGILDRFDELEIEAIDKLTSHTSKATTEEISMQQDDTEVFQEEDGAALSTNSSTGAMVQPTYGNLQLERIKLEKFDGDIRNYPKFKEQFELYVRPLCLKSQLPFVLRSHLNEEVKDEVDNLDDNLETLWQRLDKKYGNCGSLWIRY